MSLIDPTKPVHGNPTTQSVRDNFGYAKSEIESVTASVASMSGAVAAEAARALAAEGLLAPQAGPTFTGTATASVLNVTSALSAPTMAPGSNTGLAATTAFVTAAITVETSRAGAAEALLAPRAGPTFTGTLTASGAVTGAGFVAWAASPPAIGSTAPSTGAFTTLSATSTVSGAGFTAWAASPPAIGTTTPGQAKFTTLSASSLILGTDTTATYLFMNNPAGNPSQVRWQTAGVYRWLVGANGAAESGSNAGSDFTFDARSDTGTALFTALNINRATGLVTLPKGAAISGGTSTIDGAIIGGSTAAAGSFTSLTASGLTTTQTLRVTQGVSLTPGSPLVLNMNTGTLAAVPLGSGLVIVGSDTANVNQSIMTWGSYVPGLKGLHAGGTRGSEVQTPSGATLLEIGGEGHDGTAYSTGNLGQIRFVATDLISPTARGVGIDFLTTNQGATAKTVKLSVRDKVLIGGQTVAAGTDNLQVTGGLTTDFLTITSGVTNTPSAAADTILHLFGEVSKDRLLLDAFNQTNFTGRRANGNSAAPSALIADEVIATFGGGGFGFSGYASVPRAWMTVRTGEDWTDLHQGTGLEFHTTPNGGTIATSSLGIDHSGIVLVGTANVAPVGTAALQVVGGMTVDTLQWMNSGTVTVVQGTTPLVINGNTGTAAVTPAAGVMLDLIGKDTSNARVSLTAYGGVAGFTGRRGNGSRNVTTALALDDTIVSIEAIGMGTTAYSSPKRLFTAAASQIWNDAANGTEVRLASVPNGTTAVVTGLTLKENGVITVGTTVAVGTNKLQVVGGVAADALNVSGTMTATGLPTSLSGLSTGAIWNNAGVLCIVQP